MPRRSRPSRNAVKSGAVCWTHLNVLTRFGAVRVNCRHYLFVNLPISSDVVEAACKTIVAQRLKRSGMKWSHAGGQAVTTPRTWLKSDRFEAGWKTIRQSWREKPAQKPALSGITPEDSRSCKTESLRRSAQIAPPKLKRATLLRCVLARTGSL